MWCRRHSLLRVFSFIFFFEWGSQLDLYYRTYTHYFTEAPEQGIQRKGHKAGFFDKDIIIKKLLFS